MPNTKKDQPGRDQPEREDEGDDSIEEEVRRNAERSGGFDDEGRPVRPTPAEGEPGLSEDEAKIAEEHGETGRSPGAGQ